MVSTATPLVKAAQKSPARSRTLQSQPTTMRSRQTARSLGPIVSRSHTPEIPELDVEWFSDFHDEDSHNEDSSDEEYSDEEYSESERQPASKQKLPALDKRFLVPRPLIVRYTSDLGNKSNKKLSVNARSKRRITSTNLKIQLFKQYADIFTCPFTLEYLVKLTKTKKLKQELQQVCDQELANQPAQVFSGQWNDRNGQPIVYYFSNRWKDAPCNIGPSKPLSAQYDGRTQADFDAGKQSGRPTVYDGLTPDSIQRFTEAAQVLGHLLPPHCPKADVRHKMTLQPNKDPRTIKYIYDHANGVQETMEERAGVYHLVHAWPQQGGAKKGLYISRDITRSGVGFKAIEGYYRATQFAAKVFSEMFQALLPDCFDKYQQAFNAGKWIKYDPGPFLGRALVYKLQVDLHHDKHDGGPTISFASGNFTGGELLLPQLGAKLAYQPGDVCLFYSSAIYHAVSTWEPGRMSSADTCTPGRLGHVYFFPEESMKQLSSKPPGWADETGMGRNMDCTYDD